MQLQYEKQALQNCKIKAGHYYLYHHINYYRYGLAGSSNTTGDDQKKLDVLANDLFINMLKSSYTVYVMASEENENMVEVEISKQVEKKKKHLDGSFIETEIH